MPESDEVSCAWYRTLMPRIGKVVVYASLFALATCTLFSCVTPPKDAVQSEKIKHAINSPTVHISDTPIANTTSTPTVTLKISPSPLAELKPRSVNPNITSPSPTTKPTATMSLIEIGEFTADVIGTDENGAMLELMYSGNEADLENLAIMVTYRQNDNVIQSTVPVEYSDGRLLAEVVDSQYEIGPVDVELKIFQVLPNNSRNLLWTQELRVDYPYDQQPPFLHWIFPDDVRFRRGGF